MTTIHIEQLVLHFQEPVTVRSPGEPKDKGERERRVVEQLTVERDTLREQVEQLRDALEVVTRERDDLRDQIVALERLKTGTINVVSLEDLESRQYRVDSDKSEVDLPTVMPQTVQTHVLPFEPEHEVAASPVATARKETNAPGKGKRQCAGECKEYKGIMSFRNDDGTFNDSCHSCRKEKAGRIKKGQPDKKGRPPVDANKPTAHKLTDGTTVFLSQRDQMCCECKRTVDTEKEPFIGGICIDCTEPELRKYANKHFNDLKGKAKPIAREAAEVIDCSPGETSIADDIIGED